MKKLSCSLLFFGVVLASAYSNPGQARTMPTLDEFRHYADLIYREVQGGEKWTSISGKYVALRFVKSDGMDEGAAQKVADLFDRCVLEDIDALKLDSPKDPIPVYLYPNSRELRFAVGADENFSGGMSLGNWAAVVMPVDGKPAELEATGAHEIGLAIVHSQLGLYSCPLFSEGIAYYVQGRMRHSPWIANPLPIEETNLTLLLDQAQSADDFLQGGHFISFLVALDNGNPTRLKALLTNLNRERIDQIREFGRGSWVSRVDRVFKDLYGVTLPVLDKKWRATFGQKVAKTG